MFKWLEKRTIRKDLEKIYFTVFSFSDLELEAMSSLMSEIYGHYLLMHNVDLEDVYTYRNSVDIIGSLAALSLDKKSTYSSSAAVIWFRLIDGAKYPEEFGYMCEKIAGKLGFDIDCSNPKKPAPSLHDLMFEMIEESKINK